MSRIKTTNSDRRIEERQKFATPYVEVVETNEYFSYTFRKMCAHGHVI